MFLQQPVFLRREFFLDQQVRSAGQGPPDRLDEPVRSDRRMVPVHQHLGNLDPSEITGTGVLRVFQQPAAEGVLAGAVRTAQHPRQQPGHRIDQHHRRQFATGEDVIADGDLIIAERGPEALVHPFVAAADKDQAFLCRQLGGRCPAYTCRALGRQQD